MYWLRRRLGCVGYPYERITRGLAKQLPRPSDSERLQLGLSEQEVRLLCHEHRLDSLMTRFGLAGGLEECCWWGSALCDIGLSARGRSRDVALLREGASFHLAFQLFDVVVDGFPRHTATLAEGLRPAALKMRVLNPNDEAYRLRCADEATAPVVALFDDAIASIGRRLHAQPKRAFRSLRMLERMYQSELRISPDPYAAKTLPVVFLGTLADSEESGRASHRLFFHLARFLSLWDDWVDLEEDMLRAAPNQFLGHPDRTRTLGRARYVGRCVARVAVGRVLHREIERRLTSPLRKALTAAEDLNALTFTKTVHACRRLVGEAA